MHSTPLDCMSGQKVEGHCCCLKYKMHASATEPPAASHRVHARSRRQPMSAAVEENELGGPFQPCVHLLCMNGMLGKRALKSKWRLAECAPILQIGAPSWTPHLSVNKLGLSSGESPLTVDSRKYGTPVAMLRPRR